MSLRAAALALLLAATLSGCGGCEGWISNNRNAARCSVLSLPL